MNKATLALYKLQLFLSARWKAIAPLVAYGVSEALAKGLPDLHTPSGIKAFASAVVVAILVHYTPNRATR